MKKLKRTSIETDNIDIEITAKGSAAEQNDSTLVEEVLENKHVHDTEDVIDEESVSRQIHAEKEHIKKKISGTAGVIGSMFSGVANGIYHNIQNQVEAKIEEKKRVLTRKTATVGLLALGGLLLTYGIVQVVMYVLGLYLFTNIAIGIIFLLAALVINLVLRD